MRIGLEAPAVNGVPLFGERINALDRTTPRTFLGPRILHHNRLLLNIPGKREIDLSGIRGLGACTFMGGGRWRDDNTGNLVSGGDPVCSAAPVQGAVNIPTFQAPDELATTNFFGTDLTVLSLAAYLGKNQAMREEQGRWMLQSGQSIPTPESCMATLRDEAQAYCGWNPGVCSGVDINSLISSMCAQYSSWYAAEVRNYAADIRSNAIYAPAGVPLTSLPANLVGQAPVNQSSSQATYQTQTVQPNLIQPSQQEQKTAPISQDGSDSGGSNGDVVQMLKDNWVLIALAAGALVLLPMLGGRK